MTTKLRLPKMHEKTHEGMRLVSVRTELEDLVYIRGAIRGGSVDIPFKKRAAAFLTETLLDAGTKTRTKKELRSLITSLGASLSFACGQDHVYFSASCLPEDVERILDIVVDCFTNAIFPTKELALAKKRALARLEEERSSTGREADRALERILYEPSHPNYPMSIDELQRSYTDVSRRDLFDFYKKFGKNGFMCVIGGDIHSERMLTLMTKKFKRLRTGSFAPLTQNKTLVRRLKEERLVPIAHKTNIDTFMGVRTLIHYKDPRFLALKVLLSMLGGGGVSTGHLMRTVRERDGLTYGVYADTSGFTESADGYVFIEATFGPAVYERGVAAIRKELKAFFTHGIHEKSLAAKKEEMIGKYIVGRSTTYALVATIRNTLEENRPLSYIAEYPEKLKSLSLKDIKAAQKLIPLTEFSLAAAGTFQHSKKKPMK